MRRGLQGGACDRSQALTLSSPEDVGLRRSSFVPLPGRLGGRGRRSVSVDGLRRQMERSGG